MKLVIPRARMPEVVLAEVVADVLRSAGQEIDAFDAAAGEARDIAAVHEGMADLGAGVADWVSWAYHARAAYEGWRHTSLRALVHVWQPQWLGIAARSESPIRTLRGAGEQRSAVRLMSHPRSGYSAGWSYLVEEVFRGHGFDLRDMATHEGPIVDGAGLDWLPAEIDRIDILALAYGPQLGTVGTTWARAQSHADLRFLVVDDDVMAAVAKRHGLGTRPLPTGGLVDVPAGTRSLYLPRFCVYASERLPDADARAIVGALHDHRDQLVAAGFSLDPLRAAGTDTGLRFHRGALAYYRERGLAPEPQSIVHWPKPIPPARHDEGLAMAHTFTDFRGSLDSSSTFADISETGWYDEAEYERFSPAEYERRYDATRARMDALGVDALIVGGGPNHWTFGGGMLWLTGHWEWHGMACYLLVPRHGEPTLVYSMGGSHLEATRHEVAIADVRPSRGGRFGEVLADIIKEKRLEGGVIGHPPIDPRHRDYMPVNQLDALRQGVPEAEFRLLDEFFHELLMVKSEEELDCVRKAGRLCVAAFDAMVERARPGVAEWELRAAAASAILQGGGDVDFLIIGATSTHDPHMIFGNPRPSGRVLRSGDVVVDELAAGYRGYTAQIGMPIFVGEPDPSAARFFDEICVPGYQHMASRLRPGNKLSEVHSAGRFFREHGCQSRPILLHGIDLVSSPPHVFVDDCDEQEIVPGQVLMLEPTPITPDGNLGLFLGHTYIVGDDGVEMVTEHSLDRVVTR